jgi:hypothetical protein
MKIISLGGLILGAVADMNRDSLETLLDYYNKDWKVDSEYWNQYGCNCIGDLDRNGKNIGTPVDSLDRLCKKWKQCLSCAAGCKSEYDEYSISLSNADYVCDDNVGSCERAICECDLAFAKAGGEVAAEWDFNLWYFGEYEFFDPETQCFPANGNGNFQGECCENPDSGHYIFFNANTHCCDLDGSIQTNGNCTLQTPYGG